MTQACAINNCKRTSRTLCHCCNQNLCRDHFNEHDDLLNSQLNPLIDEINALADRLRPVNIDKITRDAHHKLNQWRIDCHQIIDRFYEEKCKELDRCVNETIDKQRQEVADLRSKMSKLIEEQETTTNDIDSLTSAIHNLEEKMNEIEQIRIQIDIRPLIIDSSSIQIGKSQVSQFNLFNLSPPHRTIKRSRKSDNLLASNDRCLLMHAYPDLCLVNEDLLVMKQKKWDHGEIADMCWSSVLGCFIVVTEKSILLVDENTMSVEPMQQIQAKNCWACGCSNKSLYLSRYAWDSSVLEYSLLPSVTFVKLWKINDKLNQNQRVDAIAYNHETLALVINDQSIKAKLMELRSSETFASLWSIQLDDNYNIGTVRCCLFHHGEWLLADWSTSRLFYITNDGKLKEIRTYKSKAYHMNLFRFNILAILTKEAVNFHKL